MTQGLATSDDNGIYLAIESSGLPTKWSGRPNRGIGSTLYSKIINIQRTPNYSLLISGGLEHWCYVAEYYSKHKSLEAAAKEIVTWLDKHMKPENQAFGLLCGYNNKTPKCFRIERCKGSKTVCREVDIYNKVQWLGLYDGNDTPPVGAGLAPRPAIYNITNYRLDALVEVIQSLVDGHPGGEIRGPIHARVLRPD